MKYILFTLLLFFAGIGGHFVVTTALVAYETCSRSCQCEGHTP